MTIIEKTEIDKIEITQACVVQLRNVTILTKDGKEIAKSYHREVLFPGQDVSNQPDNVKAICSAAWTPEVIAAYEASQHIDTTV